MYNLYTRSSQPFQICTRPIEVFNELFNVFKRTRKLERILNNVLMMLKEYLMCFNFEGKSS